MNKQLLSVHLLGARVPGPGNLLVIIFHICGYPVRRPALGSSLILEEKQGSEYPGDEF